MTEPASVRSAGLDQPAGDEPCLDVSSTEWVGAARELVSQGFTFFDWLTAVDETDGAEDAGFDVVLHLLDVVDPGRPARAPAAHARRGRHRPAEPHRPVRRSRVARA